MLCKINDLIYGVLKRKFIIEKINFYTKIDKSKLQE